MNINHTIIHPWHSLSYGERAPQYVNAVIEIPQGTGVKYELDKKSGLLHVDRLLQSGIVYPCNYGFIPQTYGDDQDPLDILVFCSTALTPLSFVEVRIIGGIHMTDAGQNDEKIIAVVHSDPAMNSLYSLEELLDFAKENIKSFFRTYKIPEHKTIEVKDFFSAREAHELVLKSVESYRQKFGKR